MCVSGHTRDPCSAAAYMLIRAFRSKGLCLYTQVSSSWVGGGKRVPGRAQIGPLEHAAGLLCLWKAQPDPHPCAGDSAIAATNRGKQTNEALGLNLAAINT